jgi:hypothetical protein
LVVPPLHQPAQSGARRVVESGYGLIRVEIQVLYTVTIEKVEGGYKISPTNHIAKDLRDAEVWVRANFQVDPEEWAMLKADLDRTGKASIQRSASKPA